jgi:cytochrome P450
MAAVADGERPVELLSPAFQDDPLPVLSWYRQHQPVVQAADVPAFVLTRYDDVASMRDQSLYSTSLIRALREPIDGINIMQLDGSEHKRNRALVSSGFRPPVIGKFVETEVAPIIDHLLDDLAGRDEVDLNEVFCEKVPFWSIARLLGLDIDDEPRLAQLYRDQIAFTPLTATPEDLARSLAAREGLTALLSPAVERINLRPDESFLATIMKAESKDGDRLNEEELFGFSRFLLPAGLETTMSSMSNAIYQIVSRPGVAMALRGDSSLLGPAIEETLRWHAPISYINRVTTRPVEIHGVTMPEGSIVLGSTNSANRDAAVFAEPDVFDPGRLPNSHLAFGTGVHSCIGAPLARATLRAALPRLLSRFPDVTIADGFSPCYTGVFDNRLTRLPVRLRR